MTPPHIRNILLRGARITKRGKHVVSYNAAMGVALQGAAVLALGGALSLALPKAALAEECGDMSGEADGGTVVCDVTTYTGDGDGTEVAPGTTPISYSGTWTQDTTITIDGLFLDTGASAVTLSTAADSGAVTSSIIIENGSEINMTNVGGFGTNLQDGAEASTGSNVTLNDSVSITTEGAGAAGVRARQTGASAVGDVDVTLNDNVRITTAGLSARGALSWQTGASAEGDVVVTLNDSVSMTTEGDDAHAVYALQQGANATGDVVVTLNDSASITTAGATAHGAHADQAGANAEGNVVVTLKDSARITTAGAFAHGAHALQRGANATGDVVVTLNDSANISTSGDGARGAVAFQTGANLSGNLVLTMGDNARVVTHGRNFATGVQAAQTLASGNGIGDISVTLSKNARIETFGDTSGAILALQVTENGSGNIRATLNDSASVTTWGGRAIGIGANANGSNTEGDVLVTLNHSARVTTMGALGHGVLARSFGLGDVDVLLNNAVTVATSGAGAHAVFAEVSGRGGVPLLDEDSQPIERAVLDADGNQIRTANVSILRVHLGSNSATITMNGGTVSNSGRDSAGLFAFNENLEGNAIIAMNGGTVTSTGEGVVGLRAEISAPRTVEILESGLANFEPLHNNDGTIAVDQNGEAFMVPIYVQAPERRVDPDTGEILRSTGTAGVTVGADAAVSVSGAGATGIKVDHAGVGEVDVNVAGSVIASGEGARGISIAGASAGDVNLGITGIVQGGQGSGAYAVFIDSPDSTTVIGAGARLGTADRRFSGSVNVGGGSVTNSGTIFGGVQAGSFVNAATGSMIMGSGDTFHVTGHVTNNGRLTVGSGTAQIDGNLAGTGTITSSVNFATGQYGKVQVGSDFEAGALASIAVTPFGRTLGSVTSFDILDVTGDFDGETRLATRHVDIGALRYNLSINEGTISVDTDAPVLNPVGAVYSSLSSAVSSSFAAPGSSGNRAASRSVGTSSQPGTRVAVPASRGLTAIISTQGSMTGEQAPQESLARTVTVGPWASLEVDRATRSPDTGAVIRSTSWRFEGGHDYLVDTGGDGMLIVGAGVQLGTVSTTVRNSGGSSSSSATGVGALLSATYYSSGGTYVDGQLQISRINSRLYDQNGGLLASGVRSTAMVAAIELGHRFGLTANSALTPNVQLTLGRVNTEGFTDALGNVIARQRDNIRELRVGSEYEHAFENGGTLAVFGDYTRDLSPTSTTTINGLALSGTTPRNWGTAGLRFGAPLGNGSQLNGEVGYKTAFGSGSSNNSNAFARLGLDIRW